MQRARAELAAQPALRSLRKTSRVARGARARSVGAQQGHQAGRRCARAKSAGTGPPEGHREASKQGRRRVMLLWTLLMACPAADGLLHETNLDGPSPGQFIDRMMSLKTLRPRMSLESRLNLPFQAKLWRRRERILASRFSAAAGGNS